MNGHHYLFPVLDEPGSNSAVQMAFCGPTYNAIKGRRIALWQVLSNFSATPSHHPQRTPKACIVAVSQLLID